MSIKALAHVCICTKDLKATEEFYCKILGFEKVFEFKKNGQTTGFYLKISDSNFLEFFLDPRNYSNDSPLRHLCFETDDIKALREDLISKGINCTETILGGDASWQFWIKDPNGIDIEFHQYTENSSQKTKQPVLMTW
jgi:Lactoylglutathione lyase and related lyases